MSQRSVAILNDEIQEELQREEIEKELLKKNELRKELHKKRIAIKRAYIRRAVFITILCSFLIVLMCGYVNITVERERLSNLQKELKMQTDLQRELKLEIDGMYTLSQIEKLAQEKYSMVHPDESQIVYIDVKTDKLSNVAKDQQKDVHDNNKIGFIINFNKKLF